MSVQRLLEIMTRLRDPQHGCPWDREQTWSSIAPHTIEEAYELADAILQGDAEQVRDELGDVLFQVVFQSRIAEEQGLFDFAAVAAAVSDKLERRHPHVFGDAVINDAQAQTQAWEQMKAAERTARGLGAGALDGVTVGLPALTRSVKLGARAARVGFDWPDVDGVLRKVSEELDEIHDAIDSANPDHVREEVGDLLFSVTQVARRLGVDAESALREANAKFERRFRAMECEVERTGSTIKTMTLPEMEALWQRAKRDVG